MANAQTPYAQRAYTVGSGSAQVNGAVIANTAPSSTNVNFQVGQRWIDSSSDAEYVLTSFSTSNGVVSAHWAILGGGSSDVNVLDGDTGTASPTGGAITIAGGSGITTSATGSTLTVSLSGSGSAIDSLIPDAGTSPVVPDGDGAVSISGTADQITTTGGTNTLTLSIPTGFIAPGSVTVTEDFEVITGNVTINSGTDIIGISTDAAATTINIGTGAAVKTVTIGSTNTTSTTTIDCGSGGITLTGDVSALASVTVDDDLTARTIFADGDQGTGVVSTTALTNVVNTTQGAGTLTILSTNGNNGDNTGFLKFYVGTTVVYVPYFENISPS